MKPVLKISLFCGVVYVAISIYSHGLENAFGGALSWLAPPQENTTEVDDSTSVLEKTHFYGNVDGKDGRRKRVPITNAVRSRVNDRMAEGVRRNNRAARNSGL
jgi:hypothetical protein